MSLQTVQIEPGLWRVYVRDAHLGNIFMEKAGIFSTGDRIFRARTTFPVVGAGKKFGGDFKTIEEAQAKLYELCRDLAASIIAEK